MGVFIWYEKCNRLLGMTGIFCDLSLTNPCTTLGWTSIHTPGGMTWAWVGLYYLTIWLLLLWLSLTCLTWWLGYDYCYNWLNWLTKLWPWLWLTRLLWLLWLTSWLTTMTTMAHHSDYYWCLLYCWLVVSSITVRIDNFFNFTTDYLLNIYDLLTWLELDLLNLTYWSGLYYLTLTYLLDLVLILTIILPMTYSQLLTFIQL
jgi:hypothetical protein